MTDVDRLFIGFILALFILAIGYSLYKHEITSGHRLIQAHQCFLGADRMAQWKICEQFKPIKGKSEFDSPITLGLKFNPVSPIPIGGGFGLI